jgi:hypothetical protein
MVGVRGAGGVDAMAGTGNRMLMVMMKVGVRRAQLFFLWRGGAASDGISGEWHGEGVGSCDTIEADHGDCAHSSYGSEGCH